MYSLPADSAPASLAANRQLVEILSRRNYPLVREHMTYRQFTAGSCLWQEGDAGGYLALILTGSLETLKATEFPDHPYVAGIFSAGTVIGEDGFLSDSPRNTTVRVLKSCELLILTREKFEQLEQNHPAEANRILKLLLSLVSTRLHNAQKRLAAIF